MFNLLSNWYIGSNSQNKVCTKLKKSMPENESDRVWSTCATCQFISCDQINVKEVTDDIIDKLLTVVDYCVMILFFANTNLCFVLKWWKHYYVQKNYSIVGADFSGKTDQRCKFMTQ